VSDAGTTDGGASVDGGALCQRDDDCRANGLVCDTAAGRCIPGRGCNADAECQLNDPADPCYRFGEQCRCDRNDAPTGFAGTCRRRLGVCERCVDDSQCGSDPIIFGPPDGLGAGRCVALMGDPSGAAYCRRQRVGQCPCGFIDDGTGFCAPQSNSCSMVGCNTDSQCSSGRVCSVSRPDAGAGACGGLCVPRCRWDFSLQQEAAPGCPAGQSCWVDSANLSPASLFFGAGRCRAPCTTGADCALSMTNPFGGPNLRCGGETIPGGQSLSRCRGNGQCMDDAECPATPPTSPARGYCDRASLACRTDCRPGTNPSTGLPFDDCRAPSECVADGGTAACQLVPCATLGAAVACARGEYCCGEDKNGDGLADPCPPPSERSANGCYPAPRPPFCTACTTAAQCENAVQPAWLTACANGSRSPSCSPLPMACLSAGSRAPGQPAVSVCAPATWNDVSLTATGRTRAALGCPVGAVVTPVRPRLTGSGDDFCDTDADCNVGTTTGRCLPDPTALLPDGGLLKACLCTAGTGAAQCPNVDGGVRSTCRAGLPGQTTHCVVSLVCGTLPVFVFADAGVGGCGL
jgi:hypothetical protein